MGDSYHAEGVRLDCVLGGADTYVVPDYHRGYSWKAADAGRLWDSVMGGGGGLLGTIAVARPGGGRLELVDGQQRLAALTVMLCALRDHVREHAAGAYAGTAYLYREIGARVGREGGAALVLGAGRRALGRILEDTGGRKDAAAIARELGAGRAGPDGLLLACYEAMYARAGRYCRDEGLDFAGDEAAAIEGLRSRLRGALRGSEVILVTVRDGRLAPRAYAALNSGPAP